MESSFVRRDEECQIQRKLPSNQKHSLKLFLVIIYAQCIKICPFQENMSVKCSLPSFPIDET
jgi:hypothetical protein